MYLVSRSLLVAAIIVASVALVLAKTGLRAPPKVVENDVARQLMAEDASRDMSMPMAPEFIKSTQKGKEKVKEKGKKKEKEKKKKKDQDNDLAPPGPPPPTPPGPAATGKGEEPGTGKEAPPGPPPPTLPGTAATGKDEEPGTGKEPKFSPAKDGKGLVDHLQDVGFTITDLVGHLQNAGFTITDEDVEEAMKMIEDPAAVEGISEDILNFLKIIRDNLIDVIDDIIPDGSGDIFNDDGFVICDGICRGLTSLGPCDADFTCGCTCLAGSLGLGLTSLPVQALCLGAGPILDCETDIGDEIDELIIDTIIKLLGVLSL